MSTEWTVICEADAYSVDIASMFLFDAGATAISETERDHRIELRAGFLDEDSARSAAADITTRLPESRCEAFLDTSQDDWINAQRDGLSPTMVGQWTIRAPWHPTASDHDIVIDPGAAFGHGAHESTRLAAELMQRTVKAGDTVVDLGTGTGVLAILAAKMGATVRAVEVDPVAVDVAAENIERNGVSPQVELICADAGAAEVESTDLVVANVTLDVHRLISPTYQAAGHVIVAGILCGQVSSLSSLLDSHRAKTISTAGEWAAIDLRSPQFAQNEPKTAD